MCLGVGLATKAQEMYWRPHSQGRMTLPQLSSFINSSSLRAWPYGAPPQSVLELPLTWACSCSCWELMDVCSDWLGCPLQMSAVHSSPLHPLALPLFLICFPRSSLSVGRGALCEVECFHEACARSPVRFSVTFHLS